MPNAVVSTGTERFELKSLEGAYIVLKRMSYGDMLKRQDMAAKVLMESSGKGKKAPQSAQMEFAQQKVFQYELGKCVVDHNLTDENDQTLNLTQPGTLDRLDPKVGAEIDKLISDMNQFEEDTEGNS